MPTYLETYRAARLDSSLIGNANAQTHGRGQGPRQGWTTDEVDSEDGRGGIRERRRERQRERERTVSGAGAALVPAGSPLVTGVNRRERERKASGTRMVATTNDIKDRRISGLVPAGTPLTGTPLTGRERKISDDRPTMSPTSSTSRSITPAEVKQAGSLDSVSLISSPAEEHTAPLEKEELIPTPQDKQDLMLTPTKAGVKKTSTTKQQKPAPSPTKKQTAKKQSKPKLDIPKQRGQWDSKEVRTKFARWQVLDEPSSDDDDSDVEENAEAEAEEDADVNEDVSGDQNQQQPEKEPDIEKVAVKLEIRSPKKPSKPTEQNPIRINKVPKKRIVSDEHWKKNRAAARAISEQPGLAAMFAGEGLFVSPGSKNPEGWVRPVTLPTKKGQPGWKRPLPQTNTATKPKSPIKGAGQRAKSMEVKRDFRFQGELDEDNNDDAELMAKKDAAADGVALKPQKSRKIDTETPKVWKSRPSKFAETSPKKANAVSPDDEPSPIIPSSGSSNRMQSWLMQTSESKVEDLSDPNKRSDRPRSLSDLGSMLGPRHTSVRPQSDGHMKQRHRRKTPHRSSSSPVQSDSDEERSTSPSLGLRRSPATKKAHSPKRNSSRGWEADENESSSRRSGSSGRELHRKPRDSSPLEGRPRDGRSLGREIHRKPVGSSPGDAKDRDQLPMRNGESMRSTRSRCEYQSIDHLTVDFKNDEEKYRKDLRTLVDGVIPVLLKKGIDLPNTGKDSTLARTRIMDLAVTLDRLQGSHNRLIGSGIDTVIAWALKSHEIYAEYIRAWKLGFQDMVIDLVPADGSPTNSTEQADVTVLLKRPLVRIKQLAKAITTLNKLQPSEDAATCELKYQDLVQQSRIKQDMERARLEDEAAAKIDPTRTRNPETLAPLPEVTVRADRCVRARDTFDMHINHTSGQKLDCRVILYLRNDDGKSRNIGDVLFCQTEGTATWLLFPPTDLRQLSARQGDTSSQLVVMIRGPTITGEEWRELIYLTCADPHIISEWLHLLGTTPMPPKQLTSRTTNPSTVGKPRSEVEPSAIDDDDELSDLDLPLGEQSVLSLRSRTARVKPPGEARIQAWLDQNTSSVKNNNRPGSSSDIQSDVSSWPSSASNSIRPAESDGGVSQYQPPPANFATRAKNNLKNMFSDLHGPGATNPVKGVGVKDQAPRRPPSGRPPLFRQLSPIPSESMPIVEKSRTSDLNSSRHGSGVNRPTDLYEAMGLRSQSMDHQPTQHVNAGLSPSDPGLLSRQRYHGRTKSMSANPSSSQDAAKTSPSQLHGQPIPQLSPTTQTSNTRRRSSSPLKHEVYRSSDSEASSAKGDLLSEDDESITSESSVDDDFPVGSPDDVMASMKDFPQRSRPNSLYTPAAPASLAPSQSASQGPYREPVAPPQNRTIASIFAWSNNGRWEPLHPDECSVIVSPGLIEAFEMSAAHSYGRPDAKRPLIALELTPLVPLRQGTAIDISIRSPPTANSLLRTSNNIMFRSRSGNECDALYQMINQARINNPRYIALQNARGPFASGPGWAAHMDREANSRQGSGSWWRIGSRSGSYRASSRHQKTFSVAETRSSVASMSSAISALRRFSVGNSKMFNVAKSTISSRAGLNSHQHSRRTSSSWTSSGGGGDSGASTPPIGHAIATMDPSLGTPAGITNQKIRLYERETASKWRDKGSARMTIMHPPRPASITTAQLLSPSGHLKLEKRLLITGKTRGEILLDEILGETAFERVARTGLAVSIVQQFEIPGKTGTVGSSRVRIYLIQMKSEAEAAHAFSLLGRLRY